MPQEGDNEDGGSVDNHNSVAGCVFVIDFFCVLVLSPSVTCVHQSLILAIIEDHGVKIVPSSNVPRIANHIVPKEVVQYDTIPAFCRAKQGVIC